MITSALFTQVGLDSGALGLLGSVAHVLEKPGEYDGTVLVDDADAGQFQVVVREGGASQVDVDLASVATGRGDDCGCSGTPGPAILRPGGHLLLHVGSGRGRYAAVLATGLGDNQQVVFDSRLLDASDVFAATVLRPGRYQVTNTENGATAALEVSYPERGRRPYRPADPVRVEVGAEFSPREIQVGPAQGQVFAAQGPARVTIELAEPYDRNPEQGQPVYRKVRGPRAPR